ncbi:MAG: 50S ribosomal protein L13 [Chlorobiaceae bacterium]|nr:50S ribosomal protein L13 [Chlorobiaceae bacterium]
MALRQKLTHSFRQDEVLKKWFLVDAEGQTLGRLASRIATVLRGKNKPQFTTNADCGDFVIVVNADKIKIAAKREELKTYFHHTLYPAGATVESYKELMKTNPERIVTMAIKGMIPHNRLGVQVIKKLKVYRGTEHPHSAQKPEPLKFGK